MNCVCEKSSFVLKTKACSFTLIRGLHYMVVGSLVTIAMALIVQVYSDTLTIDLYFTNDIFKRNNPEIISSYETRLATN